MNYQEALRALVEGKKVKLPEWTGYWFREEGEIKVLTRTGDILTTPWVEQVRNRTDWQITEGNLGFDFAILALKAGKKVARKGWNGKGMWLEMQVPDEHSKMSLPYIYMFTACKNRVQWLASQTGMLADDWEVIE